MTKILRILNRLNVGGPTYNVANLSKYIGEPYETKILSAIKEPNEASSEYILQELGLDYTLVPTMQRAISFKKDFAAFRFIKEQVELYKPTIMHTHAAKAGALGRLAGLFATNKPKVMVHTYHGNVFDGYFSPLKTKIILAIERFLAKKSTAIISISETQKKDLVEKYKIAPAHKIHVIPLGFNLDRFTENIEAKRKKLRAEMGIDDDTIVISITGRLAPVKNHALFIDAMAIIKEKTTKKLLALVVGDGELREELREQVRTLGRQIVGSSGRQVVSVPTIRRSDDILFLSWRKDIDVINAASDIVVLSSKNEGTPVSIIEAMATGRAVVATKVGGVPDVVMHGVNGLLSDETPEDFSTQILKLIENEGLRMQFASNASKSVLEKYSYQRLVRDMRELYEGLLRNC